jgi:ketosteroid isomerase-like protein
MEIASSRRQATSTFIDPRVGERRPIADLIAYFTNVWADPPAEGYRFLDLFSEDVQLAAPLAGRSRGRDAGYAAFRRTFALMPDLTAVVDDWAVSGDRIWIAMRFRTRTRGRRLEWASIDVLHLEDGLVTSRRAYFDPLPVLAYVMGRPSLLARWLRVRLGPAPPTFPHQG